jgi:DNA-binding XRE family transcriptional regulator
MTHDEKLFFKQLGARIAALRKDQGLTRAQLAQALELTQQMVASNEVGAGACQSRSCRRSPTQALNQSAFL